MLEKIGFFGLLPLRGVTLLPSCRGYPEPLVGRKFQ